MKIFWKKDKYAVAAMSCFTVTIFLLAILTHGTMDEGDSINHYLFAKYALIHPDHFFNHWAKPLYVFIAFPFAQFGFIGVKLLNVFLSCISLWFVYLTARTMHYRWALAVFPIAIFFKLFMMVSLSGLTEPLHNAILAIAIYCIFTKRYIHAALLVSFLPFVRSEGLSICLGFAAYFILMRQWKVLPLLAVGHIIFGFAGLHYHSTPLWVVTEIPYAGADQHYGHGHWSYYAKQLPDIEGIVNIILLLLGLVGIGASSIYFVFRRQWDKINTGLLFVACLFIGFFAMHTAFWALGIYGSFGLTRVFMAVGCTMILLSLTGLEYLAGILSRFRFHAIALSLILLVASILTSFIPSPYSYSPSFDFGLHPDQLCDIQVANYVKKNYPDYHKHRIFCEAAYMGEVLDLDIFNEDAFQNNNSPWPAAEYPSKSIVIWDDWYSEFEHGAHLDVLRANKSIHECATFTHPNPWGGERKVVVFARD